MNEKYLSVRNNTIAYKTDKKSQDILLQNNATPPVNWGVVGQIPHFVESNSTVLLPFHSL